MDGISDFASTWNIVRKDRESQRKSQTITPVQLCTGVRNFRCIPQLWPYYVMGLNTPAVRSMVTNTNGWCPWTESAPGWLSIGWTFLRDLRSRQARRRWATKISTSFPTDNCEPKVGQEAQPLLMAAAKPTAGSPVEKRCPLHPLSPCDFWLT